MTPTRPARLLPRLLACALFLAILAAAKPGGAPMAFSAGAATHQ